MNIGYDEFYNTVTNEIGDCEDFVYFGCGVKGNRFALMYIKGITSRDYISERLLRPLQREGVIGFNGDFGALLESTVLTEASDALMAAEMIVKGDVLVLIESENGFFSTLANAQFTHGRSVDEPSSDVTVRGPKAGFVEDAEINMSLLRKYIRSPKLKFRRFTVGSISETKVIMAYVTGRADEKLINSLAERLNALDASVVTDSANITMLLDGSSNPPIPSCGSTEKVDKAASKLMAGRVALIVDGSPFVITLPFVFAESLQASDDYLHTPYYATFIRLLRLAAFAAAVFAPAILCTAVTYNYSEMPPELYGIIAESRKDIPISFFWEVVAILLLFELLREVGVRMPRTVGDAVGIVGSIILGNTAVEAGIVSSVGVITVALSAVCAFMTPAYMYVIVLARLGTLVMAELFGIYGLGLSAAVLIMLFCGKESFGVPYMSPLAPFSKQGMQDFIFCWPKKTLGRKEDLGGKQ